jgi:hypothetical protein
MLGLTWSLIPRAYYEAKALKSKLSESLLDNDVQHNL